MILLKLLFLGTISILGETAGSPPNITHTSTTQNSTAVKSLGNSNMTSVSSTIYTMTHFHGVWWTLDLSEGCVDVPGLLFQKTSSIDTHNNCVMLFSQETCLGRSVVVAPGTSGHSDLGWVNFDNLLASMKPCGYHEKLKNVTQAITSTTHVMTTTTQSPPGKDAKPGNGHIRITRADDNVENGASDQMQKKNPNITLSNVIY